MTTSLITISIVGLLAGFLFSMPVAGPISILITSNALKGRLRYAHLVTIGASFADFFYVFIAVFGLTKLYSAYKPFIPYVLFLGAVFLFYLGYKITRTKLDFGNVAEKNLLPEDLRKKDWGGFHIGFMVSFLNPTLFLSWLTSSFFVISFVASLGFNTGGLEKKMNEGIQEINKTEKNNQEQSELILSVQQVDSSAAGKQVSSETEQTDFPKSFPLLLSLFYAFFLAIGSIIWFYTFAYFLARFRHRINIRIIQRIIQALGIVLFLFGLMFFYKGIRMFV